MLPFSEPERLVSCNTEGSAKAGASSDNNEAVFSYPMYKDLRDRNQVLDGVIARASGHATVSYGGETERA